MLYLKFNANFLALVLKLNLNIWLLYSLLCMSVCPSVSQIALEDIWKSAGNTPNKCLCTIWGIYKDHQNFKRYVIITFYSPTTYLIFYQVRFAIWNPKRKFWRFAPWFKASRLSFFFCFELKLDIFVQLVFL